MEKDVIAITGRFRAHLADRYRFERELGAGGMAFVYLAEDLKHHRHVALKVLRPELSALLGAERFLKEIHVTANLQHPHLLPLFDSGEVDGLLFYVMPYVGGESLRAKISRERQLSVDEAVRITTQVASALDYAHRHGVIHRDIKPENILLQDGQALIADFGIALALREAGGDRLTQTGLSLGTPQYMSPEQASGDRVLDARSDVYSLAAVLYEMLAGEPPHTGPTVQAVIAKLLAERPRPIADLRSNVPSHVAAAVDMALAKLPADRFDTAARFTEALTTPGFQASGPAVAASDHAFRRPWRLHPAWTLGTAAACLLAGGLLGRVTSRAPAIIDFGLPDTARIAFVDPTPWAGEKPAIAVSPDGKFFVYVAQRNLNTELWYRSLTTLEVRPLPGTSRGYLPALSPDGRTVAFIADRLIKTVPVDGSAPARDIAEVLEPQGLLWDTADVILTQSIGDSELKRVDVSTGTVQSVAGAGCSYPSRIPGSSWLACSSPVATQFLRLVSTAADAGTGKRRTLALAADTSASLVGGHGRVIDGRLVFMTRDGNLAAVAFDTTTSSASAPVVLERGLRRSMLYLLGHYGVTQDGDLVYVPGVNAALGRFVLRSLSGEERTLPLPPREYLNYGVSADGARIAVTIREQTGMELWVYGAETGQGERVARGFSVGQPAWAPDGRVAFTIQGTAASPSALVVMTPGKGETVDTLRGLPGFAPSQWYAGSWIGTQSGDIVIARLADGRVSADTLKLPETQYFPTVSPDGPWVAYTSTEKGIPQVYVTSLPFSEQQRTRVSVDAGSEPVWLPGSVIAFRTGRSWYKAVPDARRQGTPAEPQLYFEDENLLNTSGLSNVSMPDGSVLYLRSVAPATGAYVRVVRRWRNKLKEMVPDQIRR